MMIFTKFWLAHFLLLLFVPQVKNSSVHRQPFVSVHQIQSERKQISDIQSPNQNGQTVFQRGKSKPQSRIIDGALLNVSFFCVILTFTFEKNFVTYFVFR